MGSCLLVAFLFSMLVHSTVCSNHRKLLQKSTIDCENLHKQCISCAAQAGVDGTVVVCLACTSPSYRVTENSRSCECSPGYSTNVNDTKSCGICGRGSYCSGGDTPRQSCGELLTTLSATAFNYSECITLPGVAYMSGASTAAKCPVDTYNVGQNQRNCTECPGELVTRDIGAASIESCEAPPGFLYRSRQAIPCAVGSYKAGINKDTVCQACAEGTSTAATQSKSSADCKVVLPGYEPILDSTGVTVIGATPCPIGSYSTDGKKCTPCTTGLTTEGTKSSAVSACVAPPGYGFYPDPLQVPPEFPVGVNASTVIACPTGWYKAGHNLDHCITCGVGFLTDANASTSSDACYIPPGWGSTRVYANISTTPPGAPVSIIDTADGQQQLVATKCNLGNYGAESKVFGLEPMPCQPCPEYTTTPDAFRNVSSSLDVSSMTMTSIQNCSNVAGYGWQHGIAAECPMGYYNPGHNWLPCQECGTGLTTARPGMTGIQDCIAKPGWQLVAMGLAASCPAGTWSAGGTQSQCTPCSMGSTTVGPASPSSNECSVCLPGWGVQADQNNGGSCVACASGTFSPGGVSSCIACKAGHTSAKQSADSSACVPIWLKVDPYSSIAAPESALRQVHTASDATSCRDACGTSTDCQFYVYRAERQDQTGCYLKVAASRPLPNTYVAFKLVTNIYTVWGADAEADAQLGNSIAQAPQSSQFLTSASQCLDACDASASCLGIWTQYNATLNGTLECRLVGGQFRHRESTFIQAVPARINDAPWAQDTDGAKSLALGPTDSGSGTTASINGTAGSNVAAKDGYGANATNEAVTRAGGADNASAANGTAPGNTGVSGVPITNAAGSGSHDGNSSAAAIPCIGYWSTSTPCNAECGGNQSMVFAIFTPAANGGSECLAKDGDVHYVPCSTRPDCPDNATESTKPPPPPTPIDCVGAWFPTSSCTGPCGNGTATVTYLITTAATNNGTECRAADGVTQTFWCEPCQGNQTAVGSPGNSAVNSSGMQSVNVRGWNPALNSPGHMNTNLWPVNLSASFGDIELSPGMNKGNSTDMPPDIARPGPMPDADTTPWPAINNTKVLPIPAVDTAARSTSEIPAISAGDITATNTPVPSTGTAGATEPTTNTPATSTSANETAADQEPAANTSATNVPASTIIGNPVNDTHAEPANRTPATSVPVVKTPASNPSNAGFPAASTPVVNGTASVTEPVATHQ